MRLDAAPFFKKQKYQVEKIQSPINQPKTNSRRPLRFYALRTRYFHRDQARDTHVSGQYVYRHAKRGFLGRDDKEGARDHGRSSTALK